MPVLAVAAWAAAVAAAALPEARGARVVVPALVVLGVVVACCTARGLRTSTRVTWAAVALVVAAVVFSAWVHREAVTHNPVVALARDGAAVEITGGVVDDPRPVASRFGDEVAVRLQVHRVVGRGWRHQLRAPVLVLGNGSWRHVPLGAEVRFTGRLAPADTVDLSAVVTGASPPVVVRDPGLAWRAAGAVRASIRDSVRGRPPDQRALVPALVDGDDAGLDPTLVDDFKTTGLTHLTAVSGTNLTLVVGFLLVLARWCGVRGRWLQGVAALGIVGFCFLARTEPSVVRAAAMGAVGLLALGANGRQRAARTLAVATVVLLLVSPGLATSAGFALSVLATAGIVLLGPPWRDALARWLPRPVAEAIAVPAAAQLACTPVVASLSGQVSLVAVAANLVVAPVVGPATVLGLGAGLVGLVCDPVARVLGTLAAWCVAWVVWVARHGAGLPVAAIGWGTGLVALGLLTLLTVLIALAGPWLLRRPSTGLAAAGLLVAGALVRLPTPGWPGTWALAMCDVGQGDALVLHAGPGAGVVVDTGPDPRPVDACLDRLDIHQVPLMVLTHFHADHVDGMSGALSGRDVRAIWTTTLLDPPEGVAEVRSLARDASVTPQLPPFGQTVRVGDVTLQPVYPAPGPAVPGPGDGSTANNASIVMVVQVDGLRILMTGDVEPPGQETIAAELPGLRVDVLKVPHHGSRYQDLPWLTSLGAAVGLVSVGADNDYGHPAASTIDALTTAGTQVYRTDQDGDVLVSGTSGHVLVRQRG